MIEDFAVKGHASLKFTTRSTSTQETGFCQQDFSFEGAVKSLSLLIDLIHSDSETLTCSKHSWCAIKVQTEALI